MSGNEKVTSGASVPDAELLDGLEHIAREYDESAETARWNENPQGGEDASHRADLIRRAIAKIQSPAASPVSPGTASLEGNENLTAGASSPAASDAEQIKALEDRIYDVAASLPHGNPELYGELCDIAYALRPLRRERDATSPLPVSPGTASDAEPYGAMAWEMAEAVGRLLIAAGRETIGYPAPRTAILWLDRWTTELKEGAASDAEPSEEEVERATTFYLREARSYLDAEKAMRGVLSDFLTRRRSGGMGGNEKVLLSDKNGIREVTWDEVGASSGDDAELLRLIAGLADNYADDPAHALEGIRSVLAERSEAAKNHSPSPSPAGIGGTGEVAPTSQKPVAPDEKGLVASAIAQWDREFGESYPAEARQRVLDAPKRLAVYARVVHELIHPDNGYCNQCGGHWLYRTDGSWEYTEGEHTDSCVFRRLVEEADLRLMTAGLPHSEGER